jgi:hypothetical protein
MEKKTKSEGSMLLQYIDNAVEIRYLQVRGNVREIRENLGDHVNVMNNRTINFRKEINELRHSNMCLWAVIFFMLIERISIHYF